MGRFCFFEIDLIMLQPNFTPFLELETERLVLRRITQDDTQELFILRSDKAVLKYIGREPMQTVDEVHAFLKTIDEGIEKNEAILWGIALKEEPSKIIGTICLWRIQPANYRAELGYMLHPQHWGRGITKEAIQKVIEYGFKTLQLHSIEARIHAHNKASAGVLHSTGFIQEGYLKEEFCFREKFSDTIIYSRLQ